MIKCKHLEVKIKPCKLTGKTREVKHCNFIGMAVSKECEKCKRKVM